MNQQRLKQLLSYDPATGVFVNLTDRAGNCKAGCVAGSVRKHGYIAITLDGKSYYAHRLAWLYVNGEFPAFYIDHKDGDGTNNRIDNIRIATPSENQCNGKPSARNTSGVRGVTWSKAACKWMAQIAKAGKTYHLGLFHDIKDAEAAVTKARESLHGDYAARRKEVMPMLLGKEAA